MTPHDSLAAYVFPDVEPRYQNPHDPRRSRSPIVTDPDGERHAARIPSPVAMTEAFARPLLEESLGAVYRLPGGKLVAPNDAAVPLDAIRDAVFAALLALPPRDDLGPHDAYTGFLRIVADEEVSYLRRYALDVARALTREGILPSPPRPPRAPRPAARTTTERKAAQRERDRDAEVTSARVWLENHLEDADPGTIAAPALFELAADGIRDVIDEFVDADEEPTHEDGTPWRVPGPRTFYAVADAILGARRRAAQGARVYTIPTPTEETPVATFPDASGDVFAEDILDRVARLVLEEQRATLCAFIERRNGATRQTEPGNITDLSAHRARRTA